MTRDEAEHVAHHTFGPRAECIRVSSNDRNNRFVLALGTYRVSTGERPTPLLLGAGCDWQSAIDNAQSTPNGLMAIEEMKKVKDMLHKAIDSATPGEFTESIRGLVLDEAKAKNLPQDAIDRINAKFDAAKKKIVETKNDDDTGKS